MQFSGGLINGALASVYGGASFVCLFYAKNMDAHMTMQKICYVLAVVGIMLAIYWLATKEVFGIPILFIGMVHAGLARWAEHDAMNVGCTGLAVATLIMAALMLTTTRPMMSKT